jgi:phage regulator Rha-like protein
MSSREIAELTGKMHFHVLVDVRAMLEQLNLVDTDIRGYYIASNGKSNLLYTLPKDLTITLVSGYSVPMRHRIVTRWLELEESDCFRWRK